MRHKSVTERAEKVLLRVIDRVLEEPKRIHMSKWLWSEWELKQDIKAVANPSPWYTEDDIRHKVRVLPPCGIVGCIAGWTVIEACKMGKKKMTYTEDDVRDMAGRILGLSKYHSYDGELEYKDNALFIPFEWPEPYRSKLRAQQPQTKGYAKVIASRLRYYIRTGK